MNPVLEAIENTPSLTPTLWWLGGAGFVVKYHSIIFYIDPVLPPGWNPNQIQHADMILRTHVETPSGADPTAEILNASRHAKVILPKSRADVLKAAGVNYHRMTTTDADLRVEYFKLGVYGRVYSVPSSHGGLHYTPLGGYPYLGYLVRFGSFTIFHAGAGSPYEELADRLKPYNVSAALLPIGNGHFSVEESAALAAEVEARWLVPMNCTLGDLDRFTDHMLGFRPDQKFKIFRPCEGWTLPAE